MTAFIGRNGQGKTNLLEALCLVSQGESFRTTQWRHCVAWGAEEARISAQVTSPSGVVDKLSMNLPLLGRKMHLWNEKSLKGRDAFTRFSPIIFSPADHTLIQGSSEERRAYVDDVAAHLWPDYFDDLKQMKKILAHRAHLLKQERADHEGYQVWTEQLLEVAPRIIKGRLRALELLHPYVQTIHQAITQNQEEISFVYQEGRYQGLSVEDIREILRKKFQERTVAEWASGRNLFGPQLEDLSIFLSQHDSRLYASQGQSRSLILSLKLAHAELIRQNRETSPMFIADDIASELDEGRRRFLLDFLLERKCQVFLSSADARLVPQENGNCALYEVVEGYVERRNDRTTSTL